MAESRIRIAVIGGGLGGATLANALVQHPHLDVSVFESAPEFSERGAAVGLSSNAIQALGLILPSSGEILEKAGAVPMNSSRLMIGSGPGAGTLVIDLGGSDPGVVVHRASLLRELLAPLPPDVLHASKKLTAIKKTADERLEITFEDGTVDVFDAVIGADGIFGSVRKYVLQDEADENGASPAGFWDCRVLVPYDKARDTLGAEFFEQDRQYGWVGDNAFIMHDILENRTMVQIVVSAIEKDPPKDRKRPLSRETLTQTMEKWLHGPIAKGVIELILEEPDVQGYSQWEHKSTPTYQNGRVCIVGDAAHATSPWQGAGAGQAIEDAMILGTLLGSVSSPAEIDAAFGVFDELRRPRGQQVIDSSRGTGLILCGQNAEVGLDPDKLRGALMERWGFIFSLDLPTYKETAVTKFRERLAA